MIDKIKTMELPEKAWKRGKNMSNIHKAIEFATIRHDGQKRKGSTIPYIVHPMEVMQILTACRFPEDTIIAGLLHDTLEDTCTKPEEIEELFGQKILEIIQANSEDKSKSWQERKQHTIDTLPDIGLDAQAVCFADKLANLRSMYADWMKIGDKLWKRFNAPKEKIQWYYQSLFEQFKKIFPDKMLSEYRELLGGLF